MQKRVSLILIAFFLSVALGFAGFAFAYEGPIDVEIGGEMKEAEKEPTPEEIERERLRRQGLEEAKKIVAAKVNDVPITMHSVLLMMNRIGGGMDVEAVKKDAINRLIIQELAYQKAKAEGIKIEDDKIDNAISNFIENLGGEDAFKKFLHRDVLTEEEIRENAKRSLMIEILFTKEVIEKTNVPENVLKEEYESLKDRLIFPEKVIVTDVYFLKADKESMKKANAILKKIKADKDKDPWKLVLDGTFIVRDIELKKDKHKELYEAAKKLKKGQLSGIVKTPASLHIIKLKDYSPEKQATLDEVRGWLEGRLKPSYQQQRQKEWEEELKKDAKIEIVEAEKK